MKKKILIFLAVFLTFSSLSHAGTIQLPQTGQTTCYDSTGNGIAGAGQDGDIQPGVAWPSPRFSEKLIWECQKSRPAQFFDSRAGRIKTVMTDRLTPQNRISPLSFLA